jgi:hypothetical protein
VASDAVGRSPRQELKDYLAVPLEDVEDVVAWLGASAKFVVQLFCIQIFFFIYFHSTTPFNIPSCRRLFTRDYLAIRGSAVASGRAFSSSGITAITHRNCLLPATFGALQLLKSTYR